MDSKTIFPENLELLAHMHARVQNMVNYGLTPHGNRLDVFFEGEMTSGFLTGKMQGVDYFLMRADGVGVIDVRASIMTIDGSVLSAQISGYILGTKIYDAQLKIETGDERYKQLCQKIIIGVGKGLPEGYQGLPEQFEVDYFYNI